MSGTKQVGRLALARRVRVMLDLDERDHAALSRLAARTGRTVPAYVVEALRCVLDAAREGEG